MFVTFFTGDQTVQGALNESDFARGRAECESYRVSGFPLVGT